jgi:hypothetical protein
MIMTHVFISYARPDEDIARELEQALTQAGFSIFRDKNPEHGIAAGTDWLDELHRALSRAGCLVYLSSASSAASAWCRAELLNSYWAGKVIIPVKLDDTDPPLSQRIQAVSLDKSPGGMAPLIDLLCRQFPFAASSLRLSKNTNPYPGLRSFEENEAELFFGRWNLADEIARQLAAPRASPDEFMLAISGPSGCGKSSLVRAGVLPLLRVRYDGIRSVGPLEPGAMAGETIGTAARRAMLGSQQAGQDAGPRVEGPARVVMVLDQAERLFTEDSGYDPRVLVRELEELAEQDAWFRCLVVFRSDIFATSAVDEAFGRYTVRAIRVPLMQRDEMRQAITEPASMVGITFEDGLVDRMLDDAGGGQALPLLAYNLWNLAARAPGDGRITRQLYDGSGGVRATLRQQADGAFGQLTHDGVQHDEVFSALRRMVSVNPDHLPTARPVSAEALDPAEQQVLETFVSRKLVVKDFVSNQAFYQPAHEELLRWPALSDYIEQHRTDLLVLDGLERQAELWSHGRRERLDGQDLAYARYLEQRGLASSKIKALIQTSQVIERPGAMIRMRRPWIFFYFWIFLFSISVALIDVIAPNRATGSPTTAGWFLVLVLIMAELLLYLLVRSKYRFSRYGFYRINGGPCGLRRYLLRWLFAPVGLVMTPVTRSFRQGRLTWVDQVTKTEMVMIKRDGSRLYGAQTPAPGP